jgi:hypothetical protein
MKHKTYKINYIFGVIKCNLGSFLSYLIFATRNNFNLQQLARGCNERGRISLF